MFTPDDFQTFLTESGTEELLQTLKAAHAAQNYQMKIERDRRTHEHNMKLVNGTEFEIVKVYKEKNWTGKTNDYAVVSDYKTALELFREYRKIGFSLKLHSLTLMVDGEKWHKVTFKY